MADYTITITITAPTEDEAEMFREDVLGLIEGYAPDPAYSYDVGQVEEDNEVFDVDFGDEPADRCPPSLGD